MKQFTKQEIDQQFKYVISKATGRWDLIFGRLGIAVPNGGKHGPCPNCDGKDRFRYDNLDNRGTWYCNQCGNGDGLSLVRQIGGCSSFEALKMVASELGISPEDALSRSNGAVKQSHEMSQGNIAGKVQGMLKGAMDGTSIYLEGKGLPARHSAIFADGTMLLPLQNIKGEITGAQTIKPGGGKMLIKGSRKKGSFIPLGKLEEAETLLISEGYATALTVSLLHEGLSLAAIDAGNLLPVAKVCRTRWPESQIIIAADNDVGESNTGKIAAEKAALAVDGWVALPPTDYKADWDDYRQQNGVEAASVAFSESLYQAEGKTSIDNLAKMAASQRGALLAKRYADIVVNPANNWVYHYDGALWQQVTDTDLCREMAALFAENETEYSPRGIDNAVEAMKLQIPVIGEQAPNLIGFENGVYGLVEKTFRAHCKEDWLQFHNGIVYSPAEEGETLKTHAPNFWRWLSHAAGEEEGKADRILASLFMVLANRYDWQLFLEITGEGGSGKSVFSYIATLLAGSHNTGSGSMATLDTARGRAQFVGKSLITLPDQARYVAEGTGIKAITGGDLVEIDGKYEKQFSAVIPAVVLVTNNEPMTFTERQGGIARRRVIFVFNNVVSDKEKDPLLSEKIKKELSVIIRHLLNEFAEPEKAKKLLHEQRNSKEALEVKKITDPVTDMCALLHFLDEAFGMMLGGGNQNNSRTFLYPYYKEFLEFHGLNNPLSVNRFTLAMRTAAKEYGAEYKTKLTGGRTRTNVQLTQEAEEYLPRAPGLDMEARAASAPYYTKPKIVK